MENTISLEGAIYFTKLSVCLVCTWPPSKRATKWDLVKADVSWCLCILNVICLLIALISSFYENASDPIILTQLICFCSACATILVKSLVLRIRRKKCQILIDEMEEFLCNCEAHERRVIQRYVDKCWIFHALISFMNYLACIPVVFGPFVISEQDMPTFAVYPFSIDSGIPMYLVFIHQSIAGLQSSAALTIDCQMALMMWFAGARLEILVEEIRDSSDLKDFRSFIQKHQRLLSYATQVADTMCYVALTTVCVSGIASIMCCMQFVGNQPLSVKMQYGPVTIVGLTNLMICTWPAENMIRVCDLMGTTVYNTPWVEMSPKITRDMIMILRSTQRPVQVSVTGFLPALSFHFYCSFKFLSGVCSYFTTIRIIMADD